MLEQTYQPALGSLTVTPRFTARPQRVLIVEDNLDSVRALAALIADMGHRISYAINGYAALEIGRKFRPHFVLLDIGLPGMDGYELCRRMKREEELQKARIVALTAYGSDEHRARTRSAGCELHLVKPVNAQTLFDLLESTLPGDAA
jgi:two-component system, chemotaxis family, CheB/CheR fusion protein